MGSLSRAIRRQNNIDIKPATKKNKKNTNVSISAHQMNTIPRFSHIPFSVLPEGLELPAPNKSCKSCYGTGKAGKMVDYSNQDLICSCVIKQIDFKKLIEEEKKKKEEEKMEI